MKASSLDNLIRCPKCERGLLALTLPQNGAVRCTACSAAYPVEDGVIDLLADVAVQRSPAQRTMEWEPLVRIYESRWWRRSRFVAQVLGIPFEQEQQLILQAAGVGSSDSVLDLAGGPGIYARPFAHQAPTGTVVILDLSFPMLRYASRRARDERLSNIILIHGTALQLPFPPNHFDVVNCCGALHLFPDVPRVLGEVHRVLKPGGRFTVAAYRRPPGGRVRAFAYGYRRRVIGLEAFSADELETRLVRVGFGDVLCHHAKRQWLIMSARKLAESAMTRQG